jgi:large subunit ribosomal protein L27
MSKVKASGSTKNLKDSNPKYLGVKLSDGQTAKPGDIIVMQRGTKFLSGKNTGLGKDHTIFAKKEGVVKFSDKRKTRFDSKVVKRKLVEIVLG